MDSSSSSSSAPRRSSRVPARPSRYDEEQLSLQLQQQDERELCQALQESLVSDDDASTDEETPLLEDQEEEEEEEKVPPAVPVNGGWTTTVHGVVLPPFTASSGPVGLLRSVQTPLSFFQLFLTPPLMEYVAECMNEYAVFKAARDWFPTNASELYCFIAVLIYMGIVPLPRLSMYWSSLYSQSFVSRCFSANRFRRLLRFFYVSTQAQQTASTDKLKKVRYFLQQLQHSFSSHFNPTRVMTVDEAMVGYKGRSELKQYIPQKPTKWGYKVWCLASCNYLLAFDVFLGKSTTSPSASPSDVVLSLVAPYSHRNHIVYLDRYFTSPNLLKELKARGFRACGTVRKDRIGLPPLFKTSAKDMQQGEMKYWQKQELGALVWQDRRAVYMLTTHRSPSEISYVSRRGSSEQMAVPTAVLDYNKHKGGVDTLDQLRQSYAVGRKSIKWWPQLVWWLIDMCILNALSLYNQQQPVKISQLEFREQLLQQLVEQYPQERARIGRPPRTLNEHTQQPHWPVSSEGRADCQYCSNRAENRTRSRVRCDVCDVALCIHPCFKLFHTQQ
jgi:Transposase IS4